MGKLIGKSENYKVCFFTGVIMGIMIGAAALSIIISYRLELYYKNVVFLESSIKERDARLERLESTINTQSYILDDIEINLLFNGDEIDRLDIEKSISEKYSSLLGKEIKSIDADLIVEVIDQRIFKLEDREYRLYFNKMILTETLRVWVKVEKR